MTKDSSGELSKEELSRDVINRLESFGFTKKNGEWQPPTHADKKKEVLREIHSERLKRWLSEHEDWIRDNEDGLFDYFADGSDVVPEDIEPKVVQVESRKERDLFRYAKYTWSLPMKQG